MKSALSLTLVLCLAASAPPLTAQEPAGLFDQRGEALQAPPGPLARANEAVGLAATAETASGVEAVQQGKQPAAQSDWSRVRKLAPGTEIILAVKGSPPGQRYFVAGDESDLTVLNLTDSTLPTAVRERLRAASKHPEDFADARKAGTFVLKKKGLLQKNAHVGSDGVFVADQKIADLGQVIENIAQNDVARAWRTPRSGMFDRPRR